MKIAEVIIQKLDTINATTKVLLERVYAIEEALADNFLLEEYQPEEPAKEVRPKAQPKKRCKSAKTKCLPPMIGQELMDDEELTEGTRKSYSQYLRYLLGERNNFVRTIELRNTSMLAKDIAAHFEESSRFSSVRTINNAITVARRYGLIEIRNSRYVFTAKWADTYRSE